MTAPTLVAAPRARPLPWRTWLGDALAAVLAGARLLGRVRWTAETWVGLGALGLPALLLVRLLPHVGWTGWVGLRAGLVALGVLAVVGLAVSARGGGSAQTAPARHICGPAQVCPRVGGMGSGHGHTTTKRGIRGRHVTVHTAPARHADPRKRVEIAARHEAGHKAVAKARGWKVRGVEVYPDGSGITRLYVPDRKYDPRDDIAVSLGGWKGAGTKDGCGSDFGHADAAYRAMAPGERDAGWREGVRRCNSALFWRGGERRRDAATLVEKGSLSS